VNETAFLNKDSVGGEFHGLADLVRAHEHCGAIAERIREQALKERDSLVIE
jgi:hypothetical protein